MAFGNKSTKTFILHCVCWGFNPAPWFILAWKLDVLKKYVSFCEFFKVWVSSFGHHGCQNLGPLNKESPKVLCLKPGAGQNIQLLCASSSPAVRNSAFMISAAQVHSTPCFQILFKVQGTYITTVNQTCTCDVTHSVTPGLLFFDLMACGSLWYQHHSPMSIECEEWIVSVWVRRSSDWWTSTRKICRMCNGLWLLTGKMLMCKWQSLVSNWSAPRLSTARWRKSWKSKAVEELMKVFLNWSVFDWDCLDNGINWKRRWWFHFDCSWMLHSVSTVPVKHNVWTKGQILSSYLINPLTARALGAPQMISQPVSSIFSCSPLPSGTWRTPGLSIPWCCLPTSSSVCLVFFPFSLCLARWFLARPDEWETWPYRCSLHLFMIVRRSSCGLIACWDLGTDFLVGNMVFVWDA